MWSQLAITGDDLVLGDVLWVPLLLMHAIMRLDDLGCVMLQRHGRPRFCTDIHHALLLEHDLVFLLELLLPNLTQGLDSLQPLNQHLQFRLQQLRLLDQLDEIMLLINGVPLDTLEHRRVDHSFTSRYIQQLLLLLDLSYLLVMLLMRLLQNEFRLLHHLDYVNIKKPSTFEVVQHQNWYSTPSTTQTTYSSSRRQATLDLTTLYIINKHTLRFVSISIF